MFYFYNDLISYLTLLFFCMKKTILLSFLVSSFLINCSEKKNDSIADLPSEIIWQDGDKFIKNVLDSIPKVIFKGFKRGNKYTLEHSFVEETETSIIFSGTIKVLGDLNNNKIPEFLHEDLTETTDTLYGRRIVVTIFEQNTIQTLTGVEVGLSKGQCQGIIGSDENYSFDDAREGGPYLVLTGKYGYATDENCDNYQQANTKDHYTLSAGQSWVVQSFNCAIENDRFNLSEFYKLDASKLKYLPLSPGYFYDIYGLTNKLIACGVDNNDGLSHLEKVAEIKAIGSAKRRTDLMPYIEEEFKNINPEMIKWINENLIPNASDKQANGLLFQTIYDYRYKEQFRKMAALKIIIMQQEVDAQLRDYASITSTKQYLEAEERIITKTNTETYGYLEQKLYAIQELFGQAGFNTQYLESYDYGFMMRRMLDGSEPEIWNLIKSILTQYDHEWYQGTIIDKNWAGVLELDSATYFQNRLLSGVDSIILGKEAIPEGVAVVNGAGITITCKNGKEVTLINNNSDGESSASYELKGYWPTEEIILIRYMGWEEGSTLLIDLNTGKVDYRNWEIYPSKDGKYMAEAVDEMGYQAILLLKKEGTDWVEINQYSDKFIKNGFWVDDKFYFEGNQTYYTIGELKF